MNKKIAELAKQAGYTPLPGFDFANSLEETYLKKFAELIVRECAQTLTNSKYTQTRKEYYEGFNEALDYGANKILKQFEIDL
jgi:hypothetical protein